MLNQQPDKNHASFCQNPQNSRKLSLGTVARKMQITKALKDVETTMWQMLFCNIRLNVPQSQWKIVPRYRRKEANARERQRQGEINTGFDKLREKIPHPGPSNGKCEKLRKIDILHVAIEYIRYIVELVHLDVSKN